VYCDSKRATFWGQLWQRDQRPFADLLSADLIAEAARQGLLSLGQGPLNLGNLVWLALAGARYPHRSFADLLTAPRKNLSDLGGRVPPPTPPPNPKRQRHDPRSSAAPSEEAFCQARARVPWSFWLLLSTLLATRCAHDYDTHLRWRGRFRLLCLDGTTLDLPNWPALTKAFGSAGNGSGRRQTQARLVLLQFTNARLPWLWDLVPLAECEQAVAARLLTQLQADDLVLMDRGFWSYRLFWQIQNRQAFFAVRLRKQVKFKNLGALGQGDDLVEWTPASGAAKKAIRDEQLPTAIRLRVIRYQVAGFRPSAVVTNVLEAQALPAAEFVRLAVAEQGRRVVEAGLYHKRWEIETTFYELKVTQGLAENIRSRSEAGVRFEVAGHLLLYQLLRWRMVEAAVAAGLEEPLRLSYQEALQEVADLGPALLKAGRRRLPVLLGRLLERLAEHVVPYRPGRHYPRPHDTKAKAKGGGRSQPASKLAAGEVSVQEAPQPPPAEQPRVA
jgi:hypothetical protein